MDISYTPRILLPMFCSAESRDALSMAERLLDQLAGAIRARHYSIRTEQAYVQWARRYILFHRKRHPGEMGDTDVVAFLTHLAVNRGVAASTQNQALNALVFLYRHVLNRPLGISVQPCAQSARFGFLRY